MISRLKSRIGRRLVDWKIHQKDVLNVKCESIEVTFDTTSAVSKEWFYPRYLDGDMYEPEITRSVIDALEPDSVFYDVGALMGWYTVFASKVCTKGTVHSFELDKRFISEIGKSLERTGTTAELNHNAIGKESNIEVGFSGNVGVTSIDDTNHNNLRRTVNTTRLDEYSKSNSVPDVMKMDIEGYEYHALKGAEDLLNKGFPEILFLEIHPSLICNYGNNVEELLDLLDKYNYDYTAIGEHRDNNAKYFNVDAESLKTVDNLMLICKVDGGI